MTRMFKEIPNNSRRLSPTESIPLVVVHVPSQVIVIRVLEVPQSPEIQEDRMEASGFDH